MADIKQAAKWMWEGKNVTRAKYRGGEGEPLSFRCVPRAKIPTVVYSESGEPIEMYISDLLADDWEIAE